MDCPRQHTPDPGTKLSKHYEDFCTPEMAKLEEVESDDFQRNLWQIYMQVKRILTLLSYNRNHIKDNREEGRGVIFKRRQKNETNPLFSTFFSIFYHWNHQPSSTFAPAWPDCAEYHQSGQDSGNGGSLEIQRAGGYGNPVLPSLVLGGCTEYRHRNTSCSGCTAGAGNSDSGSQNQLTWLHHIKA